MTTGSCLCGSVKFETSGKLTPIQFCHCSRCRKASGSAFGAALAVKTDTFRWAAGEDLVRQFALPVRETPPPYRTAFCSRCGSSVPIHDPNLTWVIIPTGGLDNDPEVRPFRHIFVGIKAPWFDIHDTLPQFEAHVPPEQRLPRRAE